MARRPEESTFRRVLCAVDAEWLEGVVCAWVCLRVGHIKGRRCLSFDGKAVRGARDKDGKAPHLLSGIVHGTHAVIAQTRVPDKTNEIPCLRRLLTRFALAGVLVIADALHTQRETCQAIGGQTGAYLLTVRANQVGLLDQLSRLPWKDVPARSWHDRSHGRRIRRHTGRRRTRLGRVARRVPSRPADQGRDPWREEHR
jgi:predicted transposase YbfD/YdcC